MTRQHSHANAPERYCNRYGHSKPPLMWSVGPRTMAVFAAIYLAELIVMLCLVFAP